MFAQKSQAKQFIDLPLTPESGPKLTHPSASDATGVTGNQTNPHRPFYHPADFRKTAIHQFYDLQGPDQVCHKPPLDRDRPLAKLKDFSRGNRPGSWGKDALPVRFCPLTFVNKTAIGGGISVIISRLLDPLIDQDPKRIRGRGPSSDDLYPLGSANKRFAAL